METGVTDLLIELIINVVLLISFFVALLFLVRWRRRRNAEEEAQLKTPFSSPKPVAESLLEPELSELTTLPQATATPPEDEEALPDWLNDLD